MSNNAYDNMADADKGDLHDLWIEKQEREIELDNLMERLKICYNKRHPDETPFDAIKEGTKSYWRFRPTGLRVWIEKMEREDDGYLPTA